MAKEMLITFSDIAVSGRVLLLEDEAPRTCETIWRNLPFSGESTHAIYSGTLVALFIDPSIEVPEENATTCIQTGDVIFTHYRSGFRHGHPEPLSEIYWTYDRYARPTIPGQWVPATANVFGRIVGECAAFYDVCRRLPKEGTKRLEITARADPR
jgi:hypothetical protein